MSSWVQFCRRSSQCWRLWWVDPVQRRISGVGSFSLCKVSSVMHNRLPTIAQDTMKVFLRLLNKIICFCMNYLVCCVDSGVGLSPWICRDAWDWGLCFMWLWTILEVKWNNQSDKEIEFERIFVSNSAESWINDRENRRLHGRTFHVDFHLCEFRETGDKDLRTGECVDCPDHMTTLQNGSIALDSCGEWISQIQCAFQHFSSEQVTDSTKPQFVLAHPDTKLFWLTKNKCIFNVDCWQCSVSLFQCVRLAISTTPQEWNVSSAQLGPLVMNPTLPPVCCAPDIGPAPRTIRIVRTSYPDWCVNACHL